MEMIFHTCSGLIVECRGLLVYIINNKENKAIII